MSEKALGKRGREAGRPTGHADFDTPVDRMKSSLAAAERAIRSRQESFVGPIPLNEYEKIYREAWRERVRKIRFTRPVVPDNSFLEKLVTEAGWVFRRSVNAGTVGIFDFAIEVETLCLPAEARLALERATGSRFSVQLIEERLAANGDGEGPRVPRPRDRTQTYEDCRARYRRPATKPRKGGV